MRRWLAVLVLVGVGTLLGAPRAALAEDLCLVVPERPRALLLGDSNIYGSLGIELERALAELGFEVERFGKSASGLAKPSFFDWRREGPALASRFDPHVVIMLFGGNDGQGLEPTDAAGERVAWKDEARWSVHYLQRVRELLDGLRGPRRQVFLLSPTNRRAPSAAAKVKRIMRLQREAARERGDVTWIDTFTLSSDPAGRYLALGTDGRGRKVRFRRSDGVHLTRAGGADLSRRLVPALLSEGLGVCR